MNVTWTILTTKGPAVGSAEVDSRKEAAGRVADGLREVLGGSYGREHEVAMRTIEREFYAAELPFTFRAGAIAITVEP